MVVSNVCIPKMDSEINESLVRKGIENAKIGRVLQYKEIPWKFDERHKRILMYIDWDSKHPQYMQIKERIGNGENIKVVNGMLIWHIYKNESYSFSRCEGQWRRAMEN